jgi:hypothetical protein
MQWMGLSRARRRGGPAAAALHGSCVARAHATSPGARARRAARGRRVHTRNERGLHMPAAARPGRKLILRLQCPSGSKVGGARNVHLPLSARVRLRSGRRARYQGLREVLFMLYACKGSSRATLGRVPCRQIFVLCFRKCADTLFLQKVGNRLNLLCDLEIREVRNS